MNAGLDRRLSVAPMLDWTDRHCRYFHRLISSQVLLYTEMVTTPAILRGDEEKHLGFSSEEHPVALQLGGSDPEALAACARIAADRGYAEINLNVGCPSDRVQKGRFGACLMKEPELVASCFDAMQSAVDIPVTIKSRIGVDDDDSYESFAAFIETVKAAGCQTFIVHARKALLQGLSPKQNRTVPPLKYHYVHDLKAAHPDLEIILNGGLESVDMVQQEMQHIDGVMIGRAFWNAPWLIHDIHQHLELGTGCAKNRDEVLLAYTDYCAQMVGQGLSLHWLIRPILGLFHGFPGNKKWKSHLVTEAPRNPTDVGVITAAREWVKNVS